MWLLDLIKHVVKEYRNIYPEIMRRAARTFDQVSSLWPDLRWDQLAERPCHTLLFSPGVWPQAGGDRHQESHVHTGEPAGAGRGSRQVSVSVPSAALGAGGTLGNLRSSASRSPSSAKTGLLFVILGVIFMKGGVVKESERSPHS